jgi:hypothetical protein
MSEEKKQACLSEIKNSLAEIPAEIQPEVAKLITHDIGVIAKAIKIANGCK